MLKEYGVKQGRTKCSGKLIIKWPKANVYFFECFTAALLGDVLKPGSEREGGREPNNSLPVTKIEKQHRYDNWIWFGWVIIRLYATAVVLRFEPRWWQVLGSLHSHRKAPAPHAAHRLCLFLLLVQAGGFGVGFFSFVFFPHSCICRGCPEGDLEPSWPEKVTSEGRGEISSPASSVLSPSQFLLSPKLFSSTLGELTLLVNQGVIYFWLHLEIK